MADTGNTSSQLGNLKRPQNWVNKFELDMNMGKDPSNMGKDPSNISNAKWVDLSQGIQSITPTSNDETTKASYWNDKGFQEMDVTGKDISIAVKGVRVVNDPAQDFISSLFLKMGDQCRTLLRWTDQSNNVILASVTIR